MWTLDKVQFLTNDTLELVLVDGARKLTSATAGRTLGPALKQFETPIRSVVEQLLVDLAAADAKPAATTEPPPPPPPEPTPIPPPRRSKAPKEAA